MGIALSTVVRWLTGRRGFNSLWEDVLRWLTAEKRRSRVLKRSSRTNQTRWQWQQWLDHDDDDAGSELAYGDTAGPAYSELDDQDISSRTYVASVSTRGEKRDSLSDLPVDQARYRLRRRQSMIRPSKRSLSAMPRISRRRRSMSRMARLGSVVRRGITKGRHAATRLARPFSHPQLSMTGQNEVVSRQKKVKLFEVTVPSTTSSESSPRTPVSPEWKRLRPSGSHSCEHCQSLQIKVFKPSSSATDWSQSRVFRYSEIIDAVENNCVVFSWILQLLSVGRSVEDRIERYFLLIFQPSFDGSHSRSSLYLESNDSDEFDYVLHGHLGAYVQDMTASMLTPPPLNMDVASRENFQQSRKWIAECHEKHPICRGSSRSMLPKRVLRISGDGTKVFLLDTNRGYDGKYAALSYCWGPFPQTVITTIATLEATRKNGIPVNELPTTLQHAVYTTRRLDLDYLWVDSLCIIQTDPNTEASGVNLDDLATRDQAEEIPRMAEIYHGAHVTISAACADTCHQGFLHRRNPEIASIPLVDMDGKSSVLNVYQSFGIVPEPIHKRAWTFQEHVLSCRILEFGTQELRRICRGDPDNQTEIFDHGNPATYDISYDASRSDKSLWAFQSGPEHIHNVWRRLVLDFTARAIGRAEDRAKAIQGIAVEYEKILKVKYLVGLWDGRFLKRDLIWERASPKAAHRPTELFVPTWSWCSVQQTMISWRPWPVDYSDAGFTVVDKRVDPNVGYPGTRLGSSTIRVTGRLGNATWEPERRFLVLPGGSQDQIVAETIADAIEPEIESEGSTSVTALEILRGSGESESVGLVLLHDGERSRFRRIGIFWTRPGDEENSLRWLGSFAVKDVTIL